MDKVLYNAKVRTLDDDNHIAEAIGIKNGKIEFIGSNRDALNLQCKEAIDLNGKLLLPGFVDSHLHMLHYAFVEKSVKLFDCKNVEECLQRAKKRLDESSEKPLTWLFCRGWNHELFDVQRYPTKRELDAISTEIPIIMVRVCGHIAVCNTRGLDLLKQIPQFKEIENDVDLETGLLRENAVQFYYSVLDAPSQNEIEDLIKHGIKKLNECGYTGIQSDDLASLPGKNWRRILNAFKSLDEKCEMNLRVYEQCLFERLDDAKAFVNEGFRTGQSGNHFTIGPMKMLQDGALGSKTAAMTLPYEGSHDNLGICIYTQEELNDIFDFHDKHNMQVAVHCIGDRAMDMVIEAIEKSSSRNNNTKGRHGIVHAQITTKEILEKMARNNILAYIQPVFVDLDMNIVESSIGKDRMECVYAWKSMLDMGIHASGGSDAPVVSFNAMDNIYFAVTRKNINGLPEEGWIPSEKLSVDEAVKLFTKYPAYASYSEQMNGTIEIGKAADLTVVEKDIYEIDPDDIKTVKIEMTILDGKTVYQR